MEPTLRVRRGVPVTVTDSENATVKVGVSAGLYVALLGAVTELIVGNCSITTDVAEDVCVALPPVLLIVIITLINFPASAVTGV